MLFIFHLFIYFKCLTVFNVSSYASKMYFMGVKGYPKALPKWNVSFLIDKQNTQ